MASWKRRGSNPWLPPRLQHLDRLLQTPLPRLRPLRLINPPDVIPAVRWRQRLEHRPGGLVLFQRLGDVVRHILTTRRPRRNIDDAIGGRTLLASLGEQPRRLHLRVA